MTITSIFCHLHRQKFTFFYFNNFQKKYFLLNVKMTDNFEPCHAAEKETFVERVQETSESRQCVKIETKTTKKCCKET